MAADADTSRDTIDALFVILDGAVMEEAAVLQSQVGEQMIALQNAGLRTALITTTRKPARFDTVIGDRLRAAGIETTLVSHRRRVANIAAMVGAVRSVSRRCRVRAVYVRGIWGPLVIRLANPANPPRYVYDIRGTIADETIVGGSVLARAKATVFGALERWCVRGAWRVTTVSRPFSDELQRAYGRHDAIVIPSCIHRQETPVSADEAQSIRDELGFSRDDLVLVYSGGTDRHQAIPRMLAIWQEITSENVRFLMLTKLTQLSDSVLAGFPRLADKIVVRSVPRDAVARYLAACDVGFILREPRLMNRVASPVKFAEYAAAGLAVVASPDIGDMSSLIADRRIGAIVDAENTSSAATVVSAFLPNVRRDRDGIRDRARELAGERYSWDVYASVHRGLYEMPDDHERNASV